LSRNGDSDLAAYYYRGLLIDQSCRGASYADLWEVRIAPDVAWRRDVSLDLSTGRRGRVRRTANQTDKEILARLWAGFYSLQIFVVNYQRETIEEELGDHCIVTFHANLLLHTVVNAIVHVLYQYHSNADGQVCSDSADNESLSSIRPNTSLLLSSTDLILHGLILSRIDHCPLVLSAAEYRMHRCIGSLLLAPLQFTDLTFPGCILSGISCHSRDERKTKRIDVSPGLFLFSPCFLSLVQL
jgi:hypothetical protein